MRDVREIEDAIRELARAGRWADVECIGKTALDLAMDERERNFVRMRSTENHVALAEKDVRDVATSELDTDDVQVIASADPLVETLAIGARPSFVGLVAGSGDARAHHQRAADVGYRRVTSREDYLTLIFVTTEEQARALLGALVRAWPGI